MKKSRSSRHRRRIVITVSEAAEALSLAPTTVRKAIKNGAIGAVVINGRYKIPLIELRNFISRNTINREGASPDFSECFLSI